MEMPDTNENVTTLSMNTVRKGRVNTAPFNTGLMKLTMVKLLEAFFTHSNRSRAESRNGWILLMNLLKFRSKEILTH